MSYGNESALETFLKRHYRKVKGILVRRYKGVLDEYEIDWVLNQAALKVYNAADTFDSKKGTLAGWFTTIAINTAVDLLRGRPKEKLKPDDKLGQLGAYSARTAADDAEESADGSCQVSRH
jgi:DNA-directed RNA polymerase specialized sigma24 family protein